MAFHSFLSNLFNDTSDSSLHLHEESSGSSSSSSEPDDLVKIVELDNLEALKGDENNVDLVEKILRKYRRYKGHLTRVRRSEESLGIELLRKVYEEMVILKETITHDRSLLNCTREIKEMSMSLGKLDTAHSQRWAIDSLSDSPTSSSFEPSSEEYSSSLDVSEKNPTPEVSFRDLTWRKPLSPREVDPISDEAKDIPWGYASAKESNESSTDSLYDIDLSSDGTPVSAIKTSKFRKKYYKTYARFQKKSGDKKNVSMCGSIPVQCWDSQMDPSKKLLNKSVQISMVNHEILKILEKPTMPSTRNMKLGKLIRKKLWEKYLDPIMSRAALTVKSIEDFLNVEPENFDSSCLQHHERNLTLQQELSNNPRPSVKYISVNSSKDSGNQKITSTLERRPYHIVCRERLKKNALDVDSLLDKAVSDICASTTFATEGLRFKKLVESCTFLRKEKVSEQFKLSLKEKERLNRLLDD